MSAPYASLVEHAAKALAFKRLRYIGVPLRWPDHSADHLRDDQGVLPIDWDFAELCRREARAVLEALGVTPEHDAIAAEPIVVNKGRVFYTTETRYIVGITPDEFILIGEQGHWIKSMAHHLRHSTKAEGIPHLSNSQQFGHGIAFNLRIKDDTPQSRDEIADAIGNYIELCRVEKERKT